LAPNADDTLDTHDARAQRELLMLALAGIASERGLAAATPGAICVRAGLPADEFERHFRSPEDCLLALYDSTVAGLTRAVEDAVRPCSKPAPPESWRQQLDAGFGAVFQYLSALPTVAHACLIEAVALGRPALDRRDAAIDRLVGHVDVLRRVQGEPIPQLAAEILVRGTYELIHARVAKGEAERLPELLDDLRKLWLGPYAPPERPRRFPRSGSDA
jgi:AcrR family transcriptional regulator